ncbi:MAG: DUF4832 domain-containing protein [Myxococcales bacterium]|nr:DUF4832 domain-containing protein [Myxococcales bacterium]
MLLLLLTACGASCPTVVPEPDAPVASSPCAPAASDELVLCPEPATGWLPIPDVGISTFYQTASEQDVPYPSSTVAYERWWWRELQPDRDRVDLAPILDLLERAEADGQDVGIRVMPEGSGKTDVPAFLIEDGLPGVSFGGGFSPDYDDERYLTAMESFVAALGAALDGHPRLAFVDIGMVGQAGEWHVSGAEKKGGHLPSRPSWERVIDAHLVAFPTTPLVMLLGDVNDGGEPVRYAVELGTGWRADCLGDNGKGWNHMDDFYLQRVEEAGLQDAWQTGPVLWETCGDFPSWKLFGADPECQLTYALGLHATGLNAKSARMPDSFEAPVDAFLARAGYRLALTELRAPATASTGEALTVHHRWSNTGVAPPYRGFRLAFRWDDGAPTVAREIRGWLPGEHVFDDVLTAPTTAGAHVMHAAILGPEGDDEPRVPLGIVGGERAGWITLGTVEVAGR